MPQTVKAQTAGEREHAAAGRSILRGEWGATLLLMATPRTVASFLMSKGVISAGWNSILTGLALLSVAYLLGSVADDDAAAPVVAVVSAVAGVWQLGRGVRAEFQRRHKSPDEAS